MTNEEILRSDFGPFADPVTDLGVDVGPYGTRIRLVRNAADHEYFIELTGAVIARHAKNRKYPSVRSLFASADFADIRSFAATQLRILRDLDPDNLIPPEGEINASNLTQPSLIKSFNTAKSTETVGVLLVDGPAGIGKTSLIQSILVQRARRQPDISAAPPILHVTSRGRRLAGLNDALAQSLQLVRARFTFDQTPVLIRHNLIQVAIDGFDELVDPEGYQDAWFALRDFFEDVRFGGPIVLAGRDTFFDQQAFLKQTSESQQDINVSHIRLQTTTPSTAKEWLKKRGWPIRELNDPYTDLVLRAGSYALRPYFLSQLAGVKRWSDVSSADLTPRSFLLERFLEREADIISSRLALEVDEIKPMLHYLFEEVAMEMADNEVDSVDIGFLQLATEMSFGESLDKAELAKLQHKAGSFALLENDSREGHRRFPHTEVAYHFLASAVIKSILRMERPRFLRRSVLGCDFLTILAENLSQIEIGKRSDFVKNLKSIASYETSFDRLFENAMAILITSLSSSTDSEFEKYSDANITDVVLFGSVSVSELERVNFQTLDAQEADLTDVKFIDCKVASLIVDETTRFSTLVPEVHQLHLITKGGRTQDIFNPDEIKAWIEARSETPAAEYINHQATKLFEKVCRVMLRQHLIKDHLSDEFGRLLKLPLWGHIEKVLIRHEMIDRVEKKAMAGAPASFVRMRDPYRLLIERHDGGSVSAIWSEVASISNAG